MDADHIIDKLVALVTTDDVDDPQSNQILAAALISRLKAVNRASNHATRLTRETTTAARQEMDQSHLGLQNLLYEKQHLEREIQKCRQFASIYQDVPLYSLDDFIKLAPEQARSSEALADEHQLMLNRLSFELAERTRLDQQKKEILQIKKDLLKESKAKQTTMDNIKAHIDQVSQLASDIQKKVDELVLPIPSIVEESNFVDQIGHGLPLVPLLPRLPLLALRTAARYDDKRRIETDVMKMLMSDYEVSLINDSMQEFYVRFFGPAETPFAGGVWKIHVELPDQYPYKSPSIGFMNKIFHPNIDELSGSVCLDVINQTWSPMFDMINIFEVFLPQLLRYPNPNDPLNGEAAALMMRHPKEYEAKVKEYVQRFATKEAADAATDGKDDEDEDEEMSDIGSISDVD